VLEGDRQIPVQTPRLGANFAPQSRDLAIPRERKPVEDFRRYVLDKPASTQNNAFQEVPVTLSQLFNTL
jgi:hypothetical protein